MRNYIRPINPPPSQNFSLSSEYSDAATCADVIRDWSSNYSAEVDGRLANYTSASQTHAGKIAECNTLQGDFEENFCNYKSNLLHVCGELDRCFGHVQALYSATSDLILQSNETRFRSFLVAKKVVCYINVLLRNLTVVAINECDQKQVDTSELNFTFPSLPTKAACDVSLVSVSPCDNEWIETKYTNKTWYAAGAVQNAPCEPCSVGTTTAAITTTSTTTTSTTEVWWRLENFTMAGAKDVVCRIPINPQTGNLKCAGGPPEVLGASEAVGFVPLGTGRSALEVFGTGQGHMLCAKMDNSSVKCWGQNEKGQLGLGIEDPKRGETSSDMGDNLPILDFGPNLKILKMVIGRQHACALLDNGKMKCWGANYFGQLATEDYLEDIGDQADESLAQLPFVDFGPDASEVVDAYSGSATTCAIFKNTSLACWGYDGAGGGANPGGDGGILGRGIAVPNEKSPHPQVVDLGGDHPIELAVGTYHVCVLLNTSKVKCWGQSQWGMLGNGNKNTIGNDANEMGENLATVPVGNVTKIAAGAYHTCAVLQSGGVTCWGWNVHGQTLPPGTLPDQDAPNSSIGDDPDEVSPANLIVDGNGQTLDATDVACGDLWSCARLRDQSIYCWGKGEVTLKYENLN